MRALMLALSLACGLFFTTGQVVATPILSLNAPARVFDQQLFDVSIGVKRSDPNQFIGAFSFDFNFFFLTGEETGLHQVSFSDQLNLGTPSGSIADATLHSLPNNRKRVEVYEVSLLPDLAGQATMFDLVTFTIRVPILPPPGRTMSVSASNFVMSDQLGNQIYPQPQAVGDLIHVVSEPSILLLMLMALTPLLFSRHGRRLRS